MKLYGVKVKWAKVHKPVGSPGFAPAWSLIATLNDEQQLAVEKAAREVSEGRHGASLGNDEDGVYIKASRKEKKTDGEPNSAPRVVDKNKQLFTKEIGNGSVCNLIVTPFEYAVAGKKGVVFLLNAVQVVELVEWAGNEDFDDEPVEGEDFEKE